ncbi:methylenetetrahydrofolate reductase [Furfurilactobacillus milii]|uniref:Methylenetetrahydrofolate reductase n=1 Tax=Furfurilactobacillus rossiae TaxID=231049 RepID=A0A7C9JD92_9LACO|nr:methylenetetrahydrofolate reductase [Furfurilactobacillus milii]MYV04793.1 hypothetical protein [Furfurilactobacillus milii]
MVADAEHQKLTDDGQRLTHTGEAQTEHPFLHPSVGHKSVLVEMDPPTTFKTASFYRGAERLRDAGVDAITLADNSLAAVRVSNVAVAAKLKLEYGIHPIVHLTTRDHNLIGIQSEIMGLHSLGIDDILAIAGNPAKAGDFPGATSVRDVNALGLIKLIKQYNTGVSPSGKDLDDRPNFCVAAAFSPKITNGVLATRGIKRKIDCGADYLITQPVFDIARVNELADAFSQCGLQIPVFVGVQPLMSKRNAEFLNEHVSGMSLPQSVLDRMAQAEIDGNEHEVGLQIAEEIADAICDRFDGVHVVTPFNRYKMAAKLVTHIRQRENVAVNG